MLADMPITQKPILAEVWKNVAFTRNERPGAFRIGGIGADGRVFNGTTSFYRQLVFQKRLVRHFAKQAFVQGQAPSLLCLPMSVGCAPLTYAMESESLGLYGLPAMPRITGMDIHQPFLDVFHANLYPADMAATLPAHAVPMITFADEVSFRVRPDIHARVEALAAMDFRDYAPETRFDFVDCCNLLQHLPAAELDRNVAKILDFAGTAAFFNRSSRVNHKAMEKAISRAGFHVVPLREKDIRRPLREALEAGKLNWAMNHKDMHIAVRPV